MGRGHSLLSVYRIADGGDFLCRCRISRPQGRPGLRGGDPHRHHCRRTHQRPREKGRPWTKCDHPVHRRLLRCCRGGSDIHPPRHLHPRGGGQFHTNVPVILVGRRAGNIVPHPFQEIFREGDARQISLPRGYGHDPDSGQR